MALNVGRALVRVIPDFTGFAAAASGGMNKAAQQLTRAGTALTLGLSVPIVSGFAKAIQITGDFHSAIGELQAIISAGDTSSFIFSPENTELLNKGLREIAKTSVFTASEITNASVTIARAGVGADNVNELLAVTDVSQQLALATRRDVDSTASILVDIARVFNTDLANKEAVTDVADTLAFVSAKTNTDLGQLFEGMKRAGPVADAFGLSLQETAVLGGTLANMGFKGSIASTSMMNAMLRMKVLTPQAKAILDKYNISVDFTKDGLLGSIEQFKEAGISVEDMAKVMGLRATPAMLQMIQEEGGLNSVLDQSKALYDELDESIKNNIEVTGGMADIMADTYEGKMELFRSNLEDLAIAIGESGLLDGFLKIVDVLTVVVQKMSAFIDANPRIANFLVIMGTIAAAIGPIALIIGGLSLQLSLMASALSAVLLGVVPVIAAFGVVISFFRRMWEFSVPLRNAIDELAFAFKWRLAIFLEENGEKFAEWGDRLGIIERNFNIFARKIGLGLSLIFNRFSAEGDGGIINMFFDTLDKFINSGAIDSFLSKIEGVFNSDKFQGFIDGIVPFFQGVANKIRGFFEELFGFIENKLANGGPIGQIGGEVGEMLADTAGSTRFDGIYNAVTGVFDRISDYVSGIDWGAVWIRLQWAFVKIRIAVHRLRKPAEELLGNFVALGDALHESLSEAVGPVSDSLGEMFNQLLPALNEVLVQMIPILTSLIGGVVRIIAAIAPQVAPIFAAIMDILGQALPPLIDATTSLVEVLMPVLTDIITRLAPVVGETLVILLEMIDNIASSPEFQEFLSVAGDLLVGAAEVIAAVVQALRDAGLEEFLVKLLDAAAKVGKLIGQIFEILIKIAESEAFKLFLEGFIAILSDAVDFIGDVADAISALLDGDLSGFLDKLWGIVTEMFDNILWSILGMFGTIPEAIGRLFWLAWKKVEDSVIDFFGDVLGWFNEHIVEPIKDAWNGLVSWFDGFGSVAGALSAAFDVIKKPVIALKDAVMWVIDNIGKIPGVGGGTAIHLPVFDVGPASGRPTASSRVERNALGSYVRNTITTSLGEMYRPETVLPLSDPMRAADLLYAGGTARQIAGAGFMNRAGGIGGGVAISRSYHVHGVTGDDVIMKIRDNNDSAMQEVGLL